MSETVKFTEDILSVAKEKAAKIITEAESEIQKALEEAKTRLSKEADDIRRDARVEAEAVKRRRMSELGHRMKLQEQQEKSKILADVLEQTRRRVIEITKDENRYFQLLVGLVADGVRELGIEEVLLHLNSNDLKRIDRRKLEREVSAKLKKPVKIEWSQDQLNAIGGAIISSLDGKTRIVNTLDQKFEALESKLMIEAGKSLFGDRIHSV